MKNEKKALIALLITVILWASAFVGIRYVMEVFTAGGLALSRYFVASVAVIVPFVLVKNKKMPQIKDLILFAILGFFGFFSYNVLLNEGEKTVSAGLANFIVAQLPIIVAILAIVFFKERINRYGVLGFIVSLSGILVILLSSEHDAQHTGILLVYGATFANATYSCMQKKLLSRYHPIEVVSYCIWFGTLALMLYLPEALSKITIADWSHLLVIIYMGIFPGAIAYLLWGYAFKYIKATAASSALYMVPIFTLILAAVFLAEIPNVGAVIGGIIAVIGSLVISRYGVCVPRKNQ
ncbi:DMT family transporter [Caedibacter taeniospiralis]|uniref:DMT family transporter n=1 Tax=Caedibacter taeniospiralis TaxID=28907 RepID=UPI000C271320|nr:DMT family transporter [Caedibacter taeniospiralis]